MLVCTIFLIFAVRCRDYICKAFLVFIGAGAALCVGNYALDALPSTTTTTTTVYAVEYVRLDLTGDDNHVDGAYHVGIQTDDGIVDKTYQTEDVTIKNADGKMSATITTKKLTHWTCWLWTFPLSQRESVVIFVPNGYEYI